MTQVRIISIENPKPSKEAGPDLCPVHYNHSKFVIRRKYVEQVLFPQISNIKIGNTKIFSAVTPEHFSHLHENGKTYGLYKGLKILVHYGCFGNFMSNFTIWQECIDINEPILILEDDAFLPKNNEKIIKDALDKYSNDHFNENAILYLLSQIPSQPTSLHEYHSKTKHKSLIKLINTSDLSGTAAYCVNPITSKILINRAIQSGMMATDGFIHTCQKESLIDVLFPVNYKECFMLHEHFASWNHIHNGNMS